MKIVTLLKQTFDTEEKIVVTPEGVDESEAKYVINPYDEYALEEALRLKEKHGGEVIAVCCGPQRAQEALRTALAVGADEAILLDSEGIPEDSYSIAVALAAVIEPLSPGIVLAGLFAVDTGSGSVALQIAERLQWPHASAAVKLTIGTAAEIGIPQVNGTSRYALVERDVEGDIETTAVPLPALITAQQGLNEPRYPSLPGIMKAKRKPLRVMSVEDLNVRSDSSSGSSSESGLIARTVRTGLFAPPPRAAGKRLGGSAAEQAKQLIQLLQHEAKVLKGDAP